MQLCRYPNTDMPFATARRYPGILRIPHILICRDIPVCEAACFQYIKIVIFSDICNKKPVINDKRQSCRRAVSSPSLFLLAVLLQCYTEKAACAFQFFLREFIQIIDNSGNRVVFAEKLIRVGSLLQILLNQAGTHRIFIHCIFSFFSLYEKLIAYKKTSGYPNRKKRTLFPPGEQGCSKITLFCYYLHKYGN